MGEGESFPEITLLPALARLLGTDLNGLLSFQQEMGREEIAAFLGRLVQVAEEGPQAAFALARAQVGQFPRCDSLALNVALTLEGVLTMAGREGSAEEREWIQALYRQAAESRDQAVACQAQAMLFGRAMEEGDFAQAEALLDRLPPSPCTTGPRWRPAWPRPRGMGTGRDSCWSTSCSNRPAGPRPPCWPCWSWPAGRAAGGSGPSGGQGRGPGPAAGARPLRRLVGPPPAGLSDPGHGRGHGGAGGAAGVFGDPLARGTSPLPPPAPEGRGGAGGQAAAGHPPGARRP
ncbi:MAG: hypothetical protein ACLR1T_17655 [Evtepia gabavorous]